MRINNWLIVGGSLSAIAAGLNVAIIFGGPNWYRFFGAGEAMARAAERGSARPVLITAGIAAILWLWAAYAFSGAGLIRRLPWLRTALTAISAIYMVRALAPIPMLVRRPELASSFLLWSSLIVLAFALTHAIGTWIAWPSIRPLGPRSE